MHEDVDLSGPLDPHCFECIARRALMAYRPTYLTSHGRKMAALPLQWGRSRDGRLVRWFYDPSTRRNLVWGPDRTALSRGEVRLMLEP